MAIKDLTHLDNLRNMFPELTPVQLETLVYFSAGFTIKDIAVSRQVSIQAVRKTLQECNRTFENNSTVSLRNIFLIRVLSSSFGARFPAVH